MNIGVYSGSFDPIHVGHLIIASYVVEFADVDEVWFVVSPQNPFKQGLSLSDENARLEMVRLALTDFPKLKEDDVELSMPKPSYTIDTLDHLSKKYPQNKFSLIIGADNWACFDRWKEPERLIKNYDILIYPRLGFEIKIDGELKDKVKILDSPIIEISSTFIRENISKGKSLKAWLPKETEKYIVEQGLYRKRVGL